ncbi:hypothetical protein AC52_4080 [Escherichia coli 5-366-08_S3_C3]|nr:hypothetical protein ECSTECC16502_1111 [Escherichia coli STEC_C165-02]KDX30181.1 hypothetical protein AB41_2311 [Escherichia coli 1-250-04_S1_C2]KEL72706.1 hypothetical protein AC52_4080 [Escherichia coli 5-366-08_S3_C3]KEL90170.1 hypothetical protein AB94_4093 [Escherichia coli 5-366-08_S3_C1]
MSNSILFIYSMILFMLRIPERLIIGYCDEYIFAFNFQ